MKTVSSLCLIMAALILLAPNANAEKCNLQILPKEIRDSHGDTYYTPLACNQTLMSFFWNTFGMEKDMWDGGLGYHDPCNVHSPLTRTFNGLYALFYSSDEVCKNQDDRSGPFLRWAACYVGDKIDDLDGACSIPSGGGAQYRSYWFLHESVTVAWPFFYDYPVPYRAAALIHEARHYEKGHDAGSHCPRQKSCDSSWDYLGSNTWEINWLWEYFATAKQAPQAARNLAADLARVRIDNAFTKHPPFQITATRALQSYP